MTPKPMRCPKCGCWVNFTYFDTAGQHWACPKCGNSSENQTIIYSTTTKIRGGLIMSELKPCPFCGSEAMPYKINGKYGYTDNRYGIECTQCGAVIEMSNGYKNLSDAVAYAWNRRANNGEICD